MTQSRPRIDLDHPRYDQTKYWGRVKHFFITTNPTNLLASSSQLEAAKEKVDRYKRGELTEVTEAEIWAAKHLVDSAFHPKTGEKMFLPGRMSAQVPINMFITGCMMTFYKTSPGVVFWHWVNQTFNAVVNYTNRSGTHSTIPLSTLGTSYLAATSAALTTALGLNSLTRKLSPLLGRLVPFCAVAVANTVNTTLMRRLELQNGIMLETEDGRQVGPSKIAAREGISRVILSRVLMTAPGMLLIPIAINKLESRGFFRKFPWAGAPLQVMKVGFILTFATPLCCAIFPQKPAIRVTDIEQTLKEKVRDMDPTVEQLYYNKGL